MNKKNEIRRIDLECPYGKNISFRRSGFTKGAWEHIVHLFGVNQSEPSKIQSITIEGEDDFGHLQISIIVES